jgi:hypothetical protein
MLGFARELERELDTHFSAPHACQNHDLPRQDLARREEGGFSLQFAGEGDGLIRHPFVSALETIPEHRVRHAVAAHRRVEGTATGTAVSTNAPVPARRIGESSVGVVFR